ncbi:LysM peptidoglycan-binding domain-containing protein [Homoserinimonas sp. A520]
MSDTLHAGTTRATPVSRLRLTRRGRTVLTTLAATPLVLAALAFALNGGMATATMEEGSTTYVTVEAGQSLWQLAEEVAPGEDIREVVAQLLRVNALESAEIFPGQQLALPNQYR